jgi:hypothetical protein
VTTLRRWVLSWSGAPTTRHNQHQRLIAFFYFCIGQGWIKENPAKRIKNVPAEQDETFPFTRDQYEALLEATYYYDSRGKERNWRYHEFPAGESVPQTPPLERTKSR